MVIGTGSIQIRPMLAQDFNSWMILCGILVNAAAPPLSAGSRMPTPIQPHRFGIPVGIYPLKPPCWH